jgi:hypothetical protein
LFSGGDKEQVARRKQNAIQCRFTVGSVWGQCRFSSRVCILYFSLVRLRTLCSWCDIYIYLVYSNTFFAVPPVIQILTVPKMKRVPY